MNKKLRVEPMSLEKVKTVLQGVNELPGSLVQLERGQEDKVSELIEGKLKGQETTLFIELPYLQVFLDKLYLQITGDSTRESKAIISLDALAQIGTLGDVLREYSGGSGVCCVLKDQCQT